VAYNLHSRLIGLAAVLFILALAACNGEVSSTQEATEPSYWEVSADRQATQAPVVQPARPTAAATENPMLSLFVGSWANEEPVTEGIARIEIYVDSGAIFVHVWGACRPTDCDWGEVTTPITNANDGTISLIWDHGFATADQEITLLPDGRLEVVSRVHFTDNSGRADRLTTDYLSSREATTPCSELLTLSSAFYLPSEGTLTNVEGQVISGSFSVMGIYHGADSYTAYLQTDPDTLILESLNTYEVSFDYLILEAPDEGFEVLFYSPIGGEQDNWLPSSEISGEEGDTGTVVLQADLADYPDYQIRWNIVGTGAIAIDNIQITNLSTGEVIATEDAESDSTSSLCMDFYDDGNNLTLGQCTTLHWEVQNATSVTLNGSQVDPQGFDYECPQSTTTYVLQAQNASEQVQEEITIEVSLLQPAAAPATYDLTAFCWSPPTDHFVFSAIIFHVEYPEQTTVPITFDAYTGDLGNLILVDSIDVPSLGRG